MLPMTFRLPGLPLTRPRFRARPRVLPQRTADGSLFSHSLTLSLSHSLTLSLSHSLFPTAAAQRARRQLRHLPGDALHGRRAQLDVDAQARHVRVSPPEHRAHHWRRSAVGSTARHGTAWPADGREGVGPTRRVVSPPDACLDASSPAAPGCRSALLMSESLNVHQLEEARRRMKQA